jgi:hypothetical protein
MEPGHKPEKQKNNSWMTGAGSNAGVDFACRMKQAGVPKGD